MELILTKDVEKIGKAGSVVKVKDGFARNFLIPRGLALPSTQANLKRIEQERQTRLAQQEKTRKQAEELSSRLVQLSLTIPVLTQEQDALYGSITAQDIARALKDEGFEIEKDSILLDEPIKALGIYEVPVRLHPEFSSKVKVWIVKK